jgi:hypothetical protein
MLTQYKLMTLYQERSDEPLPILATLATLVLATSFWITVAGRLTVAVVDDMVVLVVNLGVAAVLAVTVQFMTARSARRRSATLLERALSAVVLGPGVALGFLVVSGLVHALAFQPLLDSTRHGLYFPVAVARWGLVVAVMWVGASVLGLIVGEVSVRVVVPATQ